MNQIEPYPLPKKRILIIKDVPNLAVEEGGGMLAIPNGLGQGITQIIQQWEKDEHDQKPNVDNVQIVERMAIGCKNQMVTLTKEGSKKLQQCENHDESKGMKEVASF